LKLPRGKQRLEKTTEAVCNGRSGRRITFSRATFHNVGRMIAEMTFWVGYIPAAFTEKKQALHDMIAGCLVLRRP